MIYGGKTDCSLSDLGHYVDQAVTSLRSHVDEFDFLACTGLSGVVVAAPVALRLHKPLVVIRKPEDANMHHRGGEIISSDDAWGRYLIVDDFMCSGRTLDFIKTKLAGMNRIESPAYRGCYLYQDNSLFMAKDELESAGPKLESRTFEEMLLPPIEIKPDKKDLYWELNWEAQTIASGGPLPVSRVA